MSGTGATMAFIFATGIASAAPIGGSAISRARTARPIGLVAMLGLIGATPVSRLDVALDHLRSAKGLVRVCLTADPANFPACVDDADAVTLTLPAADRRFSMNGLAPGDYAVAVIHDENANGKLDTFAGIPREGYGFSRNAPVRFGPPRFAAARFTLGSAPGEQRIAMRYIL